jgi:hypothetical protein
LITLWDNDILLKLASFDLIDEALSLLGITRQDVYIPDAAYYTIRRSRQIARKYPADGLARAIEFTEQVHRIEEAPDPADYALLTAVPRIDLGEAALFCYLGRFADALLLTGDKNSLRALASAPSVAHVHARLTGRVVCLETLLLALIHQADFQTILSRIVPHRDCDTAIKSVFGSGHLAVQSTVIVNLEVYVSDLTAVVGGRWLRTF